MNEVSDDVFYAKRGVRDVVSKIVSEWPYKMEYTLRYGGLVVGESQEQEKQGQPVRYFLTEEANDES